MANGLSATEKNYRIRSEADGDDTVLCFDSVEGLPHKIIGDEDDSMDDVLIVLEGLEAPKSQPTLKEGTVYTISKVIGDVEVDVAGIYCVEFLLDKDSRQHYVASVGRSYVPVVQILDAWTECVPVSWRALNPSYGTSWIDACRALSSPRDWRQTLATDNVVLDVRGLRTRDEFYCYIGEAIFGYRGYAGSCLDAFDEVLKSNNPERISFLISDEAEFDAVLEKLTERADYAHLFKQILIEAGASLRVESRSIQSS